MAHDNYLKGMSNSDNGNKCGVTRQTIARWIKNHQWDEERDALVEVTREKYIATESDRIVKDKTEIDTEHKAIVNRLRSDYKEMVMGAKPCSMDELSVLSAKIRVGSEILKLEREVLGLNKIKNIDKPVFPTQFLFTLQTKDGPVTIDPKRLTLESMKDIEDILPNQNPESYSPVGEDGTIDDEFSPDEEFFEDEDTSPTMRAISG
jgi:hypothetical protein